MQELGSKPALKPHLFELGGLGLYLIRLPTGGMQASQLLDWPCGGLKGRDVASRVSLNSTGTVPTDV